MRPSCSAKSLIIVLLHCAVAGFLGCNDAPKEPAPATYPVNGKLKTRAGTPVDNGVIQLVATSGEPKTASGEIQPDGAFELSVMTGDGQKFVGAEEGEYRVTYIPRMSEAQTEVPVDLPQPVKIVPGENKLELKLP